MMVAMACPCPMHIVCNPYLLLVLSSSCTSLVIKTAPLAPSGCPCAMAPPLGLIFSIGTFNVFFHDKTTEANASLVSNTSMSLMLNPDFSSAFLVAGMIPSNIMTGSTNYYTCDDACALLQAQFVSLLSAHDQDCTSTVADL